MDTERRIKIAHITTVDMSLRFLLLNLLGELIRAGYEITGISSPGTNILQIESMGIRCISVQMTRNLTPVADLVSLCRLYQVMRKERFTIVHTHTPKAGLLGQLAARIAKVPIVVNTVHGFYFHRHMRPLWRLFYISLERIAALCSDLVFFVNEEDLVTAIHKKIGSPAKMQLLGPGGIGIDLARFDRHSLSKTAIERKRAELGLPENAQVVGFVGRLVAEKGLLEFLRSARMILRELPNVRFLVVGCVDHEKPGAVTPNTAHDYGIEKACIFTGLREDMPELYSLMDVFVLPSHREGFPLTLMEASAMRIPCVATNVRGCRQAVAHNQNGLIVPLGDVSALAHAIIELLTGREKARRMGEEGRRLALERFDERLVFDKVEAEYARLLREKGLPVPSPDPSGDARAD